MRPPAPASTLPLALAVLLASAAPLAAAPPPKTLQVGDQQLQRVGHGTRTEMLFIELYSVALYLPAGMSDPRTSRGREVPRAARAEIRYDGSLPDRIPAGWRSELMPVLDREQQQVLRQRYQALQAGDEIVIAYTPGAGTTMTVNGQPLLQVEGPDLVNAFFDLWIGPQPVSEELKQSLL